MGTRASFFIGNPSDLGARDWLGCVAWDGYPDGDVGELLQHVTTSDAFIAAVEQIKAKRDDFTDPEINSFPFPWRGDVYLTDYTYAFFDGRVQVTSYHAGWRDLTPDVVSRAVDPWKDDEADELPTNVPAPEAKGPPGPDSIMILSVSSK